MKVIVLQKFSDKKEMTVRQVDDVIEVSQERLVGLNSSPSGDLVEVIEEELKPVELTTKKGTKEYPKHTGGGWYELSSGGKIQGEVEAKQKESELRS